MGFREREKDRLALAKAGLVTAPAARDGVYRKKRRGFCIHESLAEENLFEGHRAAAIHYFAAREIPWHDGARAPGGKAGSWPSTHLCCSQSSCVNVLFPFRESPAQLARAMRRLLAPAGLAVAEVLRFDLDEAQGSPAEAVAFEWIGARNYLQETSRGRVVGDAGRSRGKGFTSADFAVRVRLDDGRVGLILGEWKYTERYSSKSIRYSRSGTDRLKIYRPALEARWSQVACPEGVALADLFFDPFDQLMRLQLLAGGMEAAGRRGEAEMGAEFAVVLHVAPRANRDLTLKVTSKRLQKLGEDVHGVWGKLAKRGKFIGLATEDLLAALQAEAPSAGWSEYVARRYAPMR